MTLNELNQFFNTYDKVESRVYEVARMCTNIAPSESIMGFSNCSDGDICVRAWSHDCGINIYCFPLKYLAMEDGEIAEEQRRLVEEEKRKERKRLEQQERQEYERLKKKYEGVAK